MPEFYGRLIQTVTEEAYFEVTAKDEAAARKKIMKQIENGTADIQWGFIYANDDEKIEYIERSKTK